MIKKTILLIMFLFPALSYAGGYQVRLQGNKQNGFGLIGTPYYFGPSNVFYNPGGIAFMEKKFDATIGGSFVNSTSKFQDKYSDYSATTNNPVSTPAYFYASFQVIKNLQLSFGFYTPYGSTSEWDEGWKGRYLIQNISLANYCFQPTISYKITDRIGIGVGFIISTGKVEINKALNYSDNSTVKLEGDADVGYGFNVGAMIKITNELTLGIDYRSKIQLKLNEGDATFKVPESLSARVPESNKFSAELPTPTNIDFGLSYQVTKQLLIAAEASIVFWSDYDSLSFKFTEKPELLNSSNPREYKNSLLFRIGGQYEFNEDLTIRLGAYYDNSPANDDFFTPETVTQNSLGLTLGLSYSPIKNLTIDVSYLHLLGLESERSYKLENFTGKYKVITAIPGIGIQYKF